MWVLLCRYTSFPSGDAKVTASTDAVRGQLRLEAPKEWRIEPASVPIYLPAAENESFATFAIHPPSKASDATLRAIVNVDGHDYSFGRERISYQHIGVHTLMPPAEAKIVRNDIKKKGELIGYIPGAGDDIPQSLQQIGYDVKLLDGSEINAENLKLIQPRRGCQELRSQRQHDGSCCRCAILRALLLRRSRYLTADLRAFPAENFGTRAAGMRRDSPVLGLRPIRAFRLATKNVPKLTKLTRFPFLSEAVTLSVKADNALLAATLVISAVDAIFAISSSFVIAHSLVR